MEQNMHPALAERYTEFARNLPAQYLNDNYTGDLPVSGDLLAIIRNLNNAPTSKLVDVIETRIEAL